MIILKADVKMFANAYTDALTGTAIEIYVSYNEMKNHTQFKFVLDMTDRNENFLAPQGRTIQHHITAGRATPTGLMFTINDSHIGRGRKGALSIGTFPTSDRQNFSILPESTDGYAPGHHCGLRPHSVFLTKKSPLETTQMQAQITNCHLTMALSNWKWIRHRTGRCRRGRALLSQRGDARMGVRETETERGLNARAKGAVSGPRAEGGHAQIA
ncbi:hypothetical protein J6590_020288 [Homalodisca vitripennis]|nr:hypothetical protein J6590_020288 [Homalodisca vitripennis]